MIGLIFYLTERLSALFLLFYGAPRRPAALEAPPADPPQSERSEKRAISERFCCKNCRDSLSTVSPLEGANEDPSWVSFFANWKNASATSASAKRKKKGSKGVEGPMADRIATRAQRLLVGADNATAAYKEVYVDQWHPTENPQGKVNLCTAENNLCDDLLHEKLEANANRLRPDEARISHYPVPGGYESTKEAAKRYLEHFHAASDLRTDYMILTPGCTAAYDMLSFCLCQPGDVVLSAAPFYGRLFNNFEERGQAEVVPVPYENIMHPRLDVAQFQSMTHHLEEDGKRVKVIVVINPNNPLGVVFPREQIVKLCNWAASKNIHVIIDEVFASTVYERSSQFESFLSYRNQVDSAKVTYLWGFSKDLCLPGLKFALVYSESEQVIKSIRRLEIMQPCAPCVQHVAEILLEDLDWLKSFHTEKNSRLLKNKNFLCAMLNKLRIDYVPCTAAFTVYVDLRRYMVDASFKGELQLWLELCCAGVFISPGQFMGGAEPGWFRVVFSGDRDALVEGLQRFERSLGQLSDKKYAIPALPRIDTNPLLGQTGAMAPREAEHLTIESHPEEPEPSMKRELSGWDFGEAPSDNLDAPSSASKKKRVSWVDIEGVARSLEAATKAYEAAGEEQNHAESDPNYHLEVRKNSDARRASLDFITQLVTQGAKEGEGDVLNAVFEKTPEEKSQAELQRKPTIEEVQKYDHSYISQFIVKASEELETRPNHPPVDTSFVADLISKKTEDQNDRLLDAVFPRPTSKEEEEAPEEPTSSIGESKPIMEPQSDISLDDVFTPNVSKDQAESTAKSPTKKITSSEKSVNLKPEPSQPSIDTSFISDLIGGHKEEEKAPTSAVPLEDVFTRPTSADHAQPTVETDVSLDDVFAPEIEPTQPSIDTSFVSDLVGKASEDKKTVSTTSTTIFKEVELIETKVEERGDISLDDVFAPKSIEDQVKTETTKKKTTSTEKTLSLKPQPSQPSIDTSFIADLVNEKKDEDRKTTSKDNLLDTVFAPSEQTIIVESATSCLEPVMLVRENELVTMEDSGIDVSHQHSVMLTTDQCHKSIDTSFIADLIAQKPEVDEKKKDDIPRSVFTLPEPLATSTLKKEKKQKVDQKIKTDEPQEVVSSIDTSFIADLVAQKSEERSIEADNDVLDTIFSTTTEDQVDVESPKKITKSESKDNRLSLKPEPSQPTIDTSFVADLVAQKPESETTPSTTDSTILDSVFDGMRTEEQNEVEGQPERKATLEEVQRFDHCYIDQFLASTPQKKITIQETTIQYESSNLIESGPPSIIITAESEAPEKPARTYTETELAHVESRGELSIDASVVPSVQEPTDEVKMEVKEPEVTDTSFIASLVAKEPEKEKPGESGDDLLATVFAGVQKDEHTEPVESEPVSIELNHKVENDIVEKVIKEKAEATVKRSVQSEKEETHITPSPPKSDTSYVMKDVEYSKPGPSIDTSFIADLVAREPEMITAKEPNDDLLSAIFDSSNPKEEPSEGEPERKLTIEEVQQFDYSYIEQFIVNNPKKSSLQEAPLQMRTSSLVEPDPSAAERVAEDTVSKATSEAESDILAAVFEAPKASQMQKVRRRFVHQDSVKIIRRSRHTDEHSEDEDILHAVFAAKPVVTEEKKPEVGHLHAKDHGKKVSISAMEAVFIKLAPEEETEEDEPSAQRVEKCSKRVSISAMKPRCIGIHEEEEDTASTDEIRPDPEELASSTSPKEVDLSESGGQMKRYGRKLTKQEVEVFDSSYIEKFIAEKPRIRENSLSLEDSGVVDLSFVEEMVKKEEPEVQEHHDGAAHHAVPLKEEFAYIDNLVKAARDSKSCQEDNDIIEKVFGGMSSLKKVPEVEIVYEVKKPFDESEEIFKEIPERPTFLIHSEDIPHEPLTTPQPVTPTQKEQPRRLSKITSASDLSKKEKELLVTEISRHHPVTPEDDDLLESVFSKFKPSLSTQISQIDAESVDSTEKPCVENEEISKEIPERPTFLIHTEDIPHEPLKTPEPSVKAVTPTQKDQPRKLSKIASASDLSKKEKELLVTEISRHQPSEDDDLLESVFSKFKPSFSTQISQVDDESVDSVETEELERKLSAAHDRSKKEEELLETEHSGKKKERNGEDGTQTPLPSRCDDLHFEIPEESLLEAVKREAEEEELASEETFSSASPVEERPTSTSTDSTVQETHVPQIDISFVEDLIRRNDVISPGAFSMDSGIVAPKRHITFDQSASSSESSFQKESSDSDTSVIRVPEPNRDPSLTNLAKFEDASSETSSIRAGSPLNRACEEYENLLNHVFSGSTAPPEETTSKVQELRYRDDGFHHSQPETPKAQPARKLTITTHISEDSLRKTEQERSEGAASRHDGQEHHAFPLEEQLGFIDELVRETKESKSCEEDHDIIEKVFTGMSSLRRKEPEDDFLKIRKVEPQFTLSISRAVPEEETYKNRSVVEIDPNDGLLDLVFSTIEVKKEKKERQRGEVVVEKVDVTQIVYDSSAPEKEEPEKKTPVESRQSGGFIQSLLLNSLLITLPDTVASTETIERISSEPIYPFRSHDDSACPSKNHIYYHIVPSKDDPSELSMETIAVPKRLHLIQQQPETSDDDKDTVDSTTQTTHVLIEVTTKDEAIQECQEQKEVGIQTTKHVGFHCQITVIPPEEQDERLRYPVETECHNEKHTKDADHCQPQYRIKQSSMTPTEKILGKTDKLYMTKDKSLGQWVISAVCRSTPFGFERSSLAAKGYSPAPPLPDVIETTRK
ncbi:hypothetical protein QR680_004353 [Steinernema hermaphroditum]|uniref:Aminotransferase class I/classII large domain-containing protein n=1 Tax=Steinernema hermaphroditum TaxID=289476 RepID=A0AA39LT22_9BILA|nr:hypothetical protein QR680_004353 [Steinernema hermaphroditum]